MNARQQDATSRPAVPADQIGRLVEALQQHLSDSEIATVIGAPKTALSVWKDGAATPSRSQLTAMTALSEALRLMARAGLDADRSRRWLFNAALSGAGTPAQLLATDPYRVLAAVHELPGAADAELAAAQPQAM